MSASPRLLLRVFAAAIFMSAALLFAVQPMFTKMVLPRLGGTPSVWSVAMVFFQAALLIGLENCLDRFLLGRIDERAGVDHEDIRVIGTRGDLHPARKHAAEHDLGVDQVLGATQADHSHFGAHCDAIRQLRPKTATRR